MKAQEKEEKREGEPARVTGRGRPTTGKRGEEQTPGNGENPLMNLRKSCVMSERSGGGKKRLEAAAARACKQGYKRKGGVSCHLNRTLLGEGIGTLSRGRGEGDLESNEKNLSNKEERKDLGRELAEGDVEGGEPSLKYLVLEREIGVHEAEGYRKTEPHPVISIMQKSKSHSRKGKNNPNSNTSLNIKPIRRVGLSGDAAAGST